MYSHHLQEMVDNLASAGLLSEGSKEDAFIVMSDCWKDKMAITWSTEDILHSAREAGYACGAVEAREILQTVFHDQDAEFGVNWDTVVSLVESLCKPIPTGMVVVDKKEPAL